MKTIIIPSKQTVIQTPNDVRPALCLDLDGTVRLSARGARFIEGADDVALFDDAEEKIWEYRDMGYLVFGVSNQGGVAFGYKTPADAVAENKAMVGLFNRYPFHAVAMSYCHEHGNVEPYCHRSLLRKPDIGMLVWLEGAAEGLGYILDWDGSLLVGDRPEDRECANRAGIKFMWAWEFFGRTPPLTASGDAEAIQGHPDSGGHR